MLYKSPLMADIDVNHWRNLQALLLESAKGKRRIIVIHEDGEILKFVHSQRLDIVRDVQRVDDPHRFAEKVYRDNQGMVDFVVVFERKAADRYFAQFQDTWNPDEDLDEFVHRQFTLLDDYPVGIVTYPGKPRETLGLQWRVGASYEAVKAAVERFVPAGTSVVLGIFEGEALWTTLVLHFNQELRADVVTTVDTWDVATRGERDAVVKSVMDWANSKYGPCSLALFTDLESAKIFIAAHDKISLIQELVAKGKLLVGALPESLKQTFSEPAIV